MVKDDRIVRAVSRIRQRSERQEDLQKLLGTFVDVGILPQLDNNNNNQILYGRRGTGKTHVFKVLGSRLSGSAANTVVYIDARTLGSTTQFSDPTVPLSTRCLALFRDIMGEVSEQLLTHVVNHPSGNTERALEAIEALSDAITEPTTRYAEESLVETTRTAETVGRGGAVRVDLAAMPGGEARVSSDKRSETERSVTYKVETADKVFFPALHKHLSEVLDAAATYLYVLLDEWSSLPPDIQPYLAEFFKRGVLPVSRATLKVASLEYRSRFALVGSTPLTGFELGADIAAALDLDDYYVYDRNPTQIITAYTDMVLRHLNSELPDGYLRDAYKVVKDQI